MQAIPQETRDERERAVAEIVEAWLDNRRVAWITAELGEERDGLDREARRLYGEAMALGCSDYSFRERALFRAVSAGERLRARGIELERERDEMRTLAQSNFNAQQITRDRAERAEEELSLRCDQIQTAEAREDALRTEYAALRSAFFAYGQHGEECELEEDEPDSCNCGFDEEWKRWAAKAD